MSIGCEWLDVFKENVMQSFFAFRTNHLFADFATNNFAQRPPVVAINPTFEKLGGDHSYTRNYGTGSVTI